MKEWVTRPCGGRKTFSVCLGDEKRKTIGAKNKQTKMGKDRITYVDKSTHQVG
jgi:hypothetical protein